MMNKDGIHCFVFLAQTINNRDLLDVALLSLNESNDDITSRLVRRFEEDQMGCCRSSPDIRDLSLNSSKFTHINSPLTKAETTQLKTFLSEIPDHCRERIASLPARQLINFYQYHHMALQHGLKREWSLAISYEYRVIKGLQALLPTDKDHYIFFHFYSVLSASFLALGELESAIEGIHITLAILLKHSSMEYRTISKHYHHLANVFKVLQDWKSTTQYLIKAIDAAQLMADLDQEYISMLKTELQMAQQRTVKDAPHNFISFKVKRKRDENDHDVRRRRTAENITSRTKCSTLHFNRDQLERLLDKQAESQITNEILQDVLIHLQKHNSFNRMNKNDSSLISIQFTAAQFKNIHMQTSSSSTTIVEAALTIIIDRLNNRNIADDDRYITLKQAPVSFSYTDDDNPYTKGVRVFKMKKKSLCTTSDL